jgi:hypothetical protein
MSSVTVRSNMGAALQQIMDTDSSIGNAISYEQCKDLFIYHPLGRKLVEVPLEIAQSQKRELSVPDSPETRVVEAFENEWTRLRVDDLIMNQMRLARIYGIASAAVLQTDVAVAEPLDFENLYRAELSVNVYDPLNTAGSLVLHQDPMAIDFQHAVQIAVNGNAFHRTRTVVMMNEAPIYLQYEASGYGFVGRSVYQRSLFPLKSYLRLMEADDLVSTKLGALVAKIKQPGSIINNAMMKLFGQKREVVKEARNGGVISISPEEAIESLNFQNLDGPMEVVRKHILENIASAAGMPSKLLTEEAFVEGFGEGTEDAKAIARYIDRVREQMQPLYDFYDRLVMYRAWNPQFYAIMQKEFPEYAQVPFKQAFYQWKNSFVAKWPSLLTEPDSELVKVDEVRLRAVLAWLQLMLPQADPDNKARMIEWAVDNFNALKFLFDTPLQLDYEELANFTPEPAMGPGMPGQGMQPHPGMPGGGGAPGTQPAQGGAKLQGMGINRNFAQIPKSSANDAVEEFSRAVERMLEARNKPKLKLIEGKHAK